MITNSIFYEIISERKGMICKPHSSTVLLSIYVHHVCRVDYPKLSSYVFFGMDVKKQKTALTRQFLFLGTHFLISTTKAGVAFMSKILNLQLLCETSYKRLFIYLFNVTSFFHFGRSVLQKPKKVNL